MSAPLTWDHPKELGELSAQEIRDGGVVFHHNGDLYQSTGAQVGQGGMGAAFVVHRRVREAGVVESAVGKVYHDEYLYQLRTDPVTRADHQAVVRNAQRVTRLGHPNLLPTLISAPIADNYLCVTPRKAETLNEVIARGDLTDRQRVELLLDVLKGLEAMHRSNLIHRDVTLRNMLVDGDLKHAYLFDFDLTLSLDDVKDETYKERYKGRVFGSPGYSVPPEILDTTLMDCEISTSLDLYAVGSALFSLFTDELPYGPTEDMWGLLLRISEGIVFGSESHVVYPDSVPNVLRPIIERCLERNPSDRYATVGEAITAITAVLPKLSIGTRTASRSSQTLRYGLSMPQGARVKKVYEAQRSTHLSEGAITEIDSALAMHGYEIQRSLGRVKDFPIFLAVPIQELVAMGRFPDSNTYPKIVTALDLRQSDKANLLVDRWLGGYLPILRSARQGLLTALYRVVHDDSGYLFLFSEYVDNARFGTDLEGLDLGLHEALSLGYLVATQVERLHSRGMAHNNIGARALLLKGMHHNRSVRPAMVGLVAPSLNETDIANDVTDLATLITNWIRQTTIEAADEIARARLLDVWSRLKDAAKTGSRASTRDVVELMADGLSIIDFNFGVLRENAGDLEAYALLLLSNRMYARLWGK